MTYSEKLKDPRWQRKRLDILNRDGFTCKMCRNEDKTLHVHHKFYKKDTDPWAYENDVYITLCEDCHIAEEEYKGYVKDIIEKVLLKGVSNVAIYRWISEGYNEMPEINPIITPDEELDF